jgi:hypothetical protein
MGFCWQHPSLTAMEVVWRWLFGVPFLAVLWMQAQQVLAQIPPSSVGLDRLNLQNPWVSSVLLVDAAGQYRPAVVEVLRWLAPVAVVGWAILSGLGRSFVLWRMGSLDEGASHRPASFSGGKIPGVIAMQGIWAAALLGCLWLWSQGVSWAAATHITSATEPDLVGYLCWLIFLSLGLFVLWAMMSWTLAIAPLLYVLEGGSIFTALRRSFRLGKTFSGKLAEVNLVMAIVKIALIVLAMVFSAAPLPFSDQFGPDFMHVLYVAIAVGFLVSNDYFHVVRLRSFVGFWRVYRGAGVGAESPTL